MRAGLRGGHACPAQGTPAHIGCYTLDCTMHDMTPHCSQSRTKAPCPHQSNRDLEHSRYIQHIQECQPAALHTYQNTVHTVRQLPDLDAVLRRALRRARAHPLHVLLVVGVKLLTRPRGAPLYEVHVLDAVRGRAAGWGGGGGWQGEGSAGKVYGSSRRYASTAAVLETLGWCLGVVELLQRQQSKRSGGGMGI